MIHQVAAINVGPFRDALCRRWWPHFDQYTQRQDYAESAHGDSKFIPLRFPWPITPDTVFNSFGGIDYEPLLQEDAFSDMINDLIPTAIGGKHVQRAMIVSLKPGGVIKPHRDEGLFAENTTRYHLPLISNMYAWLDVDGAHKTLLPGGLYYFPKHKLHSGGNEGAADRVHLIVDVMKWG